MQQLEKFIEDNYRGHLVRFLRGEQNRIVGMMDF